MKEALAEGKISPLRYENYKLLYEELKDVKNIEERYCAGRINSC